MHVGVMLYIGPMAASASCVGRHDDLQSALGLEGNAREVLDEEV